MRRLAGVAWLVALACVAGASRAEGQARQVVQCQNCHGDRGILGASGDSALFVAADVLTGTAHAQLGCADCHRGFEAGYPHTAEQKVVPCQTCHEQEGLDWRESVHAPNFATRGDAPTCVGCHGSHQVFRTTDRQSPTHPLNVSALCGRCHGDPRIIGSYFATEDKSQARTAVAQYFETVHGHALTDAGLTVSATCNDCHRAHKVLPASSPESSVNRDNIPGTCGTCHKGIVEVYAGSAHGLAERDGRKGPEGQPAPVCVDCHSAHGIVRANEPAWHLGVVEECGTCHAEVYKTYLETYHGKVTRLGSMLAATCADCHTPHDMRFTTDPKSSVNPANLVATCRGCHPAASANFTAFKPHADPSDPSTGILHWTWLFMTGLLIGVMAFFSLHTLLWVIRLVIDRIRTGTWGGNPDDQVHPTGGAS